MTLKDIHGIYSLVDRHRNPALLPVRRVWQGRRAHTTFRHLLHCGFPAHSSLVALQEWGVLCLAEAVVAATVWMWFLLLMGKKGVVGQPFLPWCCGDSQSMAVGLSVASRLVWCSCFCRVQGGEAVRQHCSCSRLGLGGLSQHLPGSLAVGEQPASSLGCRHLCMGSLPSCIAFQVLVLSPAFPVPSLGPQVSRCTQLHLFYGLSSAG